MKTNTWIKRSANNVMWTLFVVVFLSHSYTSEIFDSIGSEWIKFEIRVLLRTKIDIKANLHLLYLSVCTRLLVLYVVWMTVWCVRWKRVRACDYSGGFSALWLFFNSVYFCCWFVLFFFLFACQKYILMLIVTSL